MNALVAAFAFLLGSSALAAGSTPQVEISWFPYHHDPEPAWRLTVVSDGSIRYEETAEPVKLWDVHGESDLHWVVRSGKARARVASRKQRDLIESLSSLDLVALKRKYSAEFSYSSPTEVTTVVEADGSSHTVPAEVDHIITHASTYGLRVIGGDVHVDSLIYAPFQALDCENPEHPDRAAIIKFLRGWYYVLHATGPVHGFKASMFKSVMP